MARYVRKSDPTLADYRASGALDILVVQPSWLVRTAEGHQFSTHEDREIADKWAERVGGTVEWYTPTQSETWTSTEAKYDH